MNITLTQLVLLLAIITGAYGLDCLRRADAYINESANRALGFLLIIVIVLVSMSLGASVVPECSETEVSLTAPQHS